MENIILNNGVAIPQLGLGVFQMTDLAECEAAVSSALEKGYRLIDTASAYGNEVAVGQALKKSSLKRSDYFVTSKLWIQDATYEKTKLAFQKTLDNLQLDYLDMYLIHQPYNDIYGAWRAMEELYEAGKIKALGVSNFYPSRMVDFFMNTRIKPAVNQIELHPFFQEKEQQAVAAEFGIQLQSWAPLAEGKNCLFTNPKLLEIGEQYDKTPAQIALRWQLQNQLAIIPKAMQQEHQLENIDLFDFQLKSAEMEEINQLDVGKTLFNQKTDPKVAYNMNSWKIK